jgi:NAD(P)-dependent dehydrogenase (short-subunit alcohol dehydrogenase family)
MNITPSFVVPGGAQGVGRAIAERLTTDGHVVVLDTAGLLPWEHERVQYISGDASDATTTDCAATLAESAGAARRMGEQRHRLPRCEP